MAKQVPRTLLTLERKEPFPLQGIVGEPMLRGDGIRPFQKLSVRVAYISLE